MTLRALDEDREWLETNGRGGFALSTVSGVHRRRYHSLLTVALPPPGGRWMMLAKVEETLIAGGRRYELGANQYPGVVHPRGFEYLTHFTADPLPRWTYEVDGVRLKKRLCLVEGEDTLVMEYAVEDPAADVRLEWRPLVAGRDYHSLLHEHAGYGPRVDAAGTGLLRWQTAAGGPALYFGHPEAAGVAAAGHWYRDFVYATERERGLDAREDLYQPFVLELDLQRPARVVVSRDGRAAQDAEVLLAAEHERRSRVTVAARAASAFLVQRGERTTVIAGYPWFTDWGRDTMIAGPGLLRATGRYDQGRDILAAFARHTSQGMLPNWFPEDGRAPEYNTIDAALWFFEAVAAYYEATQDRTFVEREVYAVLQDIVRWHLRGTRYGIQVEADGLLTGGEPGVQLTWMDAKVDGRVITPRHGKAVEIQALWYNALRVLQTLAAEFGDPVTRLRCEEMADWARQNFEPLFWNADAGCLYDCVDGAARDGSIRPNQVFAASLRHPLVAGERARQMLDVVERELWTPMGLRTLSPRDTRYCGVYEGPPAQRDAAYHQGTVWPWLLGAFSTAYLRAYPQRRSKVDGWWQTLAEYLEQHGSLPEIADGDAPHRARGCPAQAWSVAEFCRCAGPALALVGNF